MISSGMTVAEAAARVRLLPPREAFNFCAAALNEREAFADYGNTMSGHSGTVRTISPLTDRDSRVAVGGGETTDRDGAYLFWKADAVVSSYLDPELLASGQAVPLTLDRAAELAGMPEYSGAVVMSYWRSAARNLSGRRPSAEFWRLRTRLAANDLAAVVRIAGVCRYTTRRSRVPDSSGGSIPALSSSRQVETVSAYASAGRDFNWNLQEYRQDGGRGYSVSGSGGMVSEYWSSDCPFSDAFAQYEVMRGSAQWSARKYTVIDDGLTFSGVSNRDEVYCRTDSALQESDTWNQSAEAARERCEMFWSANARVMISAVATLEERVTNYRSSGGDVDSTTSSSSRTVRSTGLLTLSSGGVQSMGLRECGPSGLPTLVRPGDGVSSRVFSQGGYRISGGFATPDGSGALYVYDAVDDFKTLVVSAGSSGGED